MVAANADTGEYDSDGDFAKEQIRSIATGENNSGAPILLPSDPLSLDFIEKVVVPVGERVSVNFGTGCRCANDNLKEINR